MSDADTFAVWINKRAVALLEMPFRHRLNPRDTGWQIEVLEPGRLTARFQNGPTENYDVEPGDTLISNGDEIYVAVQRSVKAAQAQQKSGAGQPPAPAPSPGPAPTPTPQAGGTAS